MRRVCDQFRGSPDFEEFLLWYLTICFQENVFSEGYGESRAFADGKAKMAEELYEILTGI